MPNRILWHKPWNCHKRQPIYMCTNWPYHLPKICEINQTADCTITSVYLRVKPRFIPLGMVQETGGLDDDLVKLFKRSVWLDLWYYNFSKKNYNVFKIGVTFWKLCLTMLSGVPPSGYLWVLIARCSYCCVSLSSHCDGIHVQVSAIQSLYL